jgi:hypothetical protein
MTRPLKRPMRVALADAQQGPNPYVSQPAEYGWPFLSRRILLSREPRLIRARICAARDGPPDNLDPANPPPP